MLHNLLISVRRFLPLAVALAAAQSAWAQAIVETIPDGLTTEPVDSSRNIFVLLQHPQPALLGPNALEIQRDRPRDTYKDTWARPAVWRLIGQTHEGRQRVAALGSDVSAQDAFDRLVKGFDFVGRTVDSISQFDDGSNWSIQGINRTGFIGRESGKWLDDRLVRQMFYRTAAHGVLTIRYTYFMSPDLRQIRLVAEMRMYTRAKRDPRKYAMTLKRRYEYLSPEHDRGRRAWRAGEKEAFLRTIERDMAQRTRRYPQNEAAYRKDRDNLRRALRRDPDAILLPDGMLEAWSPEELHAALELAAERMARMIRTDLARLPANERVEGRMLTVTARQADGDPKRIRAREYFRDGENTVYQTGGGNLYSIPTAE